MENKEKKKVQETATEQVQEAAQAPAQNAPEFEEVVLEEESSKYIVIPDVFVTRKCTVKGNKKYFDYTVTGKIRGVDMAVRVTPGRTESGFTDAGMYRLLELVFGPTAAAVPFAVQILTRRDFRSNRVMKSMQYFAYSNDDVEGELTAPLRFDTMNDKAIIQKFLDIADRKHGLNLPL